MYLIWIFGSKLIRSNSQSRATLWVLETCLIVGLLPLMIIFGTVTPLRRCELAVHEPRMVQLQRCNPDSSKWCYPHASWRCCPRVSWQCNSVVCQILANAVHIHVVSFRSDPRSVRFWRCNPHAPPFPCSSGSAFCTCPDGATHASQRCLPGKRPLDCIDRGTRPWWWTHSGAAVRGVT